MNRRNFLLSSASVAATLPFSANAGNISTLVPGMGSSLSQGRGPTLVRGRIPKRLENPEPISTGSQTARIPDAVKRTRQIPGGVEGYAVGNIIPDFSAPDQFGITRSIRNYVGKYVVLDFCPLWCPPCHTMSTHAAGVRKVLRDAGIPFEYLSVTLQGANHTSDSSCRADAEIWAYHAGLDSPVMYNPHQAGVPSTYGPWRAFDGFAQALGVGAFPTWAILAPNQQILHEQIGYIDGQGLLDIFTTLGISPPLTALPPDQSFGLDEVNLSLTVGGTTFRTNVPNSTDTPLGGSGLHAWWTPWGKFKHEASDSSNLPLTKIYLDVFTPRIYGGEGYLPMDVPLKLQIGDWVTSRYGAPRYIGASYWENPINEYGPGQNFLALNDALLAAGVAVTDGKLFSNTGVDQAMATFDSNFTTDFWMNVLAQDGFAGLPWWFEVVVEFEMLPPGVRMEAMIAEINAAPISAGIKQSLTTSLSNAIPAMSLGVACNWLNSFVQQVQSFYATRKISASLAARLLEEAARAKNLLGCR